MTVQIHQKSTTTADNATISYLEYTSSTSSSDTNSKPGLIVLHGGLECSYSHSELAAALCTTLPIYLPDRRGRGASSAPSSDFSMQTEINDLKALLLATGARSVLGVSGGAMITLYSTLALATKSDAEEALIKKIAIFEPSIVLDDSALFEKRRERFEREIDEGKIAEALITALSMTGMGNWFLRRAPRWVLVPLARFALRMEKKGKGPGGKMGKRAGSGGESEYSMGRLAPTLRFDFRLVKEMQGTMERLKKLNEMDVEALLLSGSKSPDYLRRNVQELGKVLPKAKHVDFQGLDHLGLGNSDVGGKPKKVAIELRKFLM